MTHLLLITLILLFILETIESTTVPTSIDWRNYGMVTPIKDQGLSSDSGWAFAAIGSLEGQFFKKTGELSSLSEQQLLDCSHNYGTNGCNGGNITSAYEYINSTDGIEPDETYFWKGINRNQCLYMSWYAKAELRQVKMI